MDSQILITLVNIMFPKLEANVYRYLIFYSYTILKLKPLLPPPLS